MPGPPSPSKTLLLFGLLFGLLTVLPGCSTLRTSPAADAAEKWNVVKTARQLVGIPYRYGGSTPKSGFDCSGLVYYSYRQAGLNISRTSKEQYHQAQPVSRRHLQPGDLIFFRSNYGGFVSHVGIYLGKGEFIHAPSRGKKVSISHLDAPYWKRHYYSAGRIH
ncbi:hypothetical protein MNBD_GAMMA24-1027 [hydrothermal vent metagenome]|uniref:NlpC/P60 domain-containing protein n=1 Tax=hydrothermal vent metagenome TaxID=652676 RepID=A0A3B1B2T3_9ZZZZ